MSENPELIEQMLKSHPRNYTIFKEYFKYGVAKDVEIGDDGTYAELVDEAEDYWFRKHRRER